MKKEREIRVNECFAKLVLEKIFPYRFTNLEKREKPDFQNQSNDVGVEVTTAVSQKEKEEDKLYSLLIHNKGTPEQQEKRKIESVNWADSITIMVQCSAG